MINIQFPTPAFKIKKEGEREFIFDEIRKRWLMLTPEEWVRQNFIQYLIQVKSYPSALIAIEKEIWLGEIKKRFDVLVYDRNHHPWMMIECKEMNVPLSDSVLQQVLRYNVSVPVQFILITNGQFTWGWQRQVDGLLLLSEIPVME